VTGASGWLGRVALDLLERAVGADAFLERVHAYASRDRAITLRSGRIVGAAALHGLADRVAAGDLVLHLAYRTREQAADDVAGYIRDNVGITAAAVAAVERGVGGVFVASSGAVYAPDGTLTTDLVGNPYGTLKHLDELAFAQAAATVGASCCISRVFAVSGPYMTKPELYALGDLIRQARSAGPITLRSGGAVIRSYAAAEDVIALGLLALLRGPAGSLVRFDTSGEVVELADLASRICRVLGRSEPRIVRPPGDGSEHRYIGRAGSMEDLAAALGVRLQDLDEQVAATASDLTDAAAP
jgi:nucleoside-diphosphate-sugar epimerase